ncbi:MAG: MmcQ/YjbR family DNA-binding protein [Salibacteraceae bacterium]
MNIEEFREYCLAKPATSESTPFDQNTLVFKVHGKMFSLTGIQEFASINLKCDPEYAIQLREENEGIQPGYHMNKTHWNTVLTDGSVTDELLLELIDHSYDLVVRGLRKKVRESLK